MTRGRYVSLPRGELAASIFGKIEGKVETIFGDSIDELSRRKEAFTSLSKVEAPVTSISSLERTGFIHGCANWFLARKAGPRSIWVTKSRPSQAEGYRPRDELVYVMYTQVGQQVARFAMRDDRTMFLFMFADEKLREPGIFRPKRSCYGSASEVAGGNVRKFWTRSTPATISISTV